MKLFLSSNSSDEKLQKKLLALFEKKPEEMKAVMIPTAGHPDIDQKYVEYDKKIIENLGINNILQVDLKEESEASLEEKLSDADLIWVGGGNTFWLLHWVRKSGFDKLLPKLLDKGCIYVGISAGSIIMGKDISISGWHNGWDYNVADLKDFTGLGFVDYVISPHYKPEDQKVLDDYAQKSGYRVVPLTDQEAVVIKSIDKTHGN